MVRRRAWCAAVVIAVCSAWAAAAVANPFCAPNFAYGNAGYGAGYSIAGVRCLRQGSGFWSSGGACGPWWRGGCRVGGWPSCGGGGFWFGWPGLGFGGCQGVTTWGGCESVYLSVPAGGGATFFSGRQVPFVTGVVPVVGGWPMNWYPGHAVGPWGWYPYAVPAPVGVGPQFGPVGVLPFLGADARPAPVRQVAAARIAPAPRLVNDAARRRAARLVAVGDRHLLAARAGAPARIRAAIDSYRRAAAAAPDDPDIRVREALALVGLGDANGADAADVEWLAARWGDRWAGAAAAMARR